MSAWRFITPPSTFFGAIVVDENGRRMIDESRYGAALGRQLVREHDGRGWILADAATMREATRQLPRESLWFQLVLAVGLSASGRVRGHTLAEVARKAGIDPAGLAVTVAAHNDAIAAGQPDPMGK